MGLGGLLVLIISFYHFLDIWDINNSEGVGIAAGNGLYLTFVCGLGYIVAAIWLEKENKVSRKY